MSEPKFEQTSPGQLNKEDVLDLNANVTARLKNPLHGIPRDRLIRDVEEFAREKDLTDETPMLIKGTILAQNPEE
jgi:hypothetical protein